MAVAGGEIVGVLQSADQAVEHGEGWVKTWPCCAGTASPGSAGRCCDRLRGLRGQGAHRRPGLGVDLTNPTGAYQLYTGVGMTVVFAADVYERVI